MTWRTFLTLFVCVTLFVAHARAQTPDPHRVVIDAARAGEPKPSYLMPVEGCYVGAVLQERAGYTVQKIVNKLPTQGLVIRYIRSYDYDGTIAASRNAHSHNLYIIDTTAAGRSIVRSGLSRDRVTNEDNRVSVLRPGESCSMWLPQPLPGADGWRVVVGRVTMRSGGSFVDVLDRCVDVLGGGWMDCRVRLDTIDYDVPERYGSRTICGTNSLGWSFTDDRLWSDKPL